MIAPLSEPLVPAPPDRLKAERQKLEALLAPLLTGTLAARGLPQQMPDDELINALAQYLELEPLERQALLQHNCLRSRAESLVQLLEMKVMMARTPGVSNVAH
jgi:Lon protease-like protein